jgi:hypothetical protein
MPLTKQAGDALAEHLHRTWTRKECLQCGGNNWALHGYVTLITADTLVATPGAPILPCAAAVCQMCGNTVLINLVVAGVPLPPGTSMPPPASSRARS